MRLTKAHKKLIVNDILTNNENIRNIKKMWAAKETTIVKYLHFQFFTQEERELIKAMPEKWLTNLRKIIVKCPEVKCTQNKYITSQHTLQSTESVYSPLNYNITIVDSSPSTVNYLKWREALLAQLRQIEDNIRSVVESASSFDKLIETWPEIADIVNKYRPSPKAPLVDVKKVTQLNKLLFKKS